MKTIGIIAEYNPFHNGHAHHLHESLQLSGATHSVAVMSGQFVQRGEPALLDKWTRARMAVEAGVNLVIELPTSIAISSAEGFASGSVALLDSLGIVDQFIFGSESANPEWLLATARLLNEEPPEFLRSLKSSLALGLSYPAARAQALNASGIAMTQAKSNDILGIEYVKALLKIKSSMTFDVIPRESVDYHSLEAQNHIASATAIRNWLEDQQHESVMQTVPSSTYNLIPTRTQLTFLDDFFNLLKSF